MLRFRDYLTSHGLFTTLRASRGQDIFVACGLLSTAKNEAERQSVMPQKKTKSVLFRGQNRFRVTYTPNSCLNE